MSQRNNVFVDLLPYASVVIIALSLIKSYTFYINFGINITDYLELSEYVTLFLESLLHLSIGSLFGMFFVIIFTLLYFWSISGDKLDNNLNSPNEVDRTETSISDPYSRKISSFSYFMAFSTIGAILLGLIIRYLFFESHFHTLINKSLSLFAILIAAFGVFALLNNYIFKLTGNRLKKPTVILIYAIIVATLNIYINTIEHVNILRESRGIYEVEIQFEDSVVKSTSHIYYLGRTKSYLFFYDWRKKKSIIYSNNDIKFFKQTALADKYQKYH